MCVEVRVTVGVFRALMATATRANRKFNAITLTLTLTLNLTLAG